MGLLRGAGAGVIGVAGMAGAITTLRRAILPPDHEVKTHPENVVERAYGLAGRAEELDIVTRRRLGDLIHYGYGAAWGAAYAAATAGRRPHPLVGGPVLAAGLWGLGFCVMFPATGVHPGPWRWEGREFLLTGVAHAVYGAVMALVLDALDGLAGEAR
ncbi:MAG: hypothetical protein ACRDUY_00685 [Nitriliruptorales bacterium]